MRIRNNPFLLTSSVVLIASAVLSPLSAQPGRRGGCAMPAYDAATEITLAGTISEVVLAESPMGWKGVHLALDTAGEVRSVHLGPASYVEEQGFSFAAGDRVEVIGSPAKCQGEDVVLAREVAVGERRLVLRDASGRPHWAGRGRG
jgi:hypothetical protein